MAGGHAAGGRLHHVDSVADRVTRVAVYKGEAIVPGRLAPGGTGAGLEVKITPGKRAYGIRINDVASLAGMVQPNSRVDIMVVIDDPEKPGRARRSCSCRTCACSPSAPRRSAPRTAAPSAPRSPRSRSRRSRPSVLAIAAAKGALQLVLRGYGDPDSISTDGADASDVLTDIKRRAPSRCLDAKRRNRAAPRNDRQRRHRSLPPPPPVVTGPTTEARAPRFVQRPGVPRPNRARISSSRRIRLRSATPRRRRAARAHTA